MLLGGRALASFLPVHPTHLSHPAATPPHPAHLTALPRRHQLDRHERLYSPSPSWLYHRQSSGRLYSRTPSPFAALRPCHPRFGPLSHHNQVSTSPLAFSSHESKFNAYVRGEIAHRLSGASILIRHTFVSMFEDIRRISRESTALVGDSAAKLPSLLDQSQRIADHTDRGCGFVLPRSALKPRPLEASNDEFQACGMKPRTPFAGFDSELSPRLSNNQAGRAVHMSSARHEEDKASSEWQTVTGICPTETEVLPLRQPTDACNDVKYQDACMSSTCRNALRERPRSLLIPADLPDPGPACERVRFDARALEDSLHNTSSVYSDGGKNEWVVQESLDHPGAHATEKNSTRQRPVTLELHRIASGELIRSCSKTSSSVSMERFKYDGGIYSVFLKSGEPKVSRFLGRSKTSTNSRAIIVQSTNTVELGPDGKGIIRDATFYNHAAIQST